MQEILYPIDEEFVPSLSILKGITASNMLEAVNRGYRKEVQIQMRYRGIRNPVGVFHNKIRHELTNYDKVRDAITLAVSRGWLDLERAYDLREALVEYMYTFVDDVINKYLPSQVNVQDATEAKRITRQQLVKYNDDWGIREIQQTDRERAMACAC